MATISTPDLFKAYLAYFGRPPDATGLAYFSNKTEAEVVAAFSASPESQALLASQGSVPAQVNAIYLNLFNRPAEFTGSPTSASYWVVEITQGRLSVAQAAMQILKSALGTDAQTVQAKYNAQVAFVNGLDTAAEVSGYAGAEAAQDAREFLATVDYQHVPTQAQVDAAVLRATTPNVKYEVEANAAQVNEGQTVVFTIATTNVPEGTLLSYAITGINAADLQSGLITGTVNVDKSGQALVQVTLKADLTTEGLETMTLTVGENLASASVNVLDTSVTPPPPPVPTYDVTPSVGTVNEGQTVIFIINTTNVAEGTLLSYKLTGITAADLQSGLLTGEVLIDQYGQALVQVTLKSDLTTEGDEIIVFNLSDGVATANVTVADTSVTPPPPPVENQILVATTGIDVLHGGAGDDTFIATNATLQNGDRFYGEAGTDQLDVEVSSQASNFMDGFKTSSVEVIRVNNISREDATLVVSDVGYDTKDGKVELFSDDAWGDVTFMDIQNISDTKLHVKDTDKATYFGYDTGNSAEQGFDNGASGLEGDSVDLTVSEMRGTTNSYSNWYSDGTRTPEDHNFWGGPSTPDTGRFGVDGALVKLYNNDLPGQESYVDKITLHSDITGQVSNTTKNTMQLVAGEDLDTLVIDGRADLEITNTLDENIRLVDAGQHENGSSDTRADLILDLSNSSDGRLFADQNAYWTDDANGDGYVSGDPEDQRSGIVETLAIIGSQGDDLITTGTTHNNKSVTLGTGNDTLVAAGWISSDMGSAAVVDGGGNDGPRHPSFEILWGGEATVDGGAGNDVIVTGNLNDLVSTGAGNDIVLDGGSTSLQTRNTNYFHLDPLNRYDTESAVQRNGNSFDLGAGNDQLTVFAALNLLGDSASVIERKAVLGSNDTVDAGEGNDKVTIYGSAIDGVIQFNSNGSPKASIWDAVTTVVNLGTGDDTLAVGDMLKGGGWDDSRGSVSVLGGEGNDSIDIARDGDQTVRAGSGDDTVSIYQDDNEYTPNGDHYDGTALDGNHRIWLEEGDDRLLITGSSRVDRVYLTEIDAGIGNDFVEIEQDHRLSVKLGEGDDTLKMRAEDLQSNDTIQGGDNYMSDTAGGYDTIVLTNESDLEWSGEVRDSETRHVFAIEQFNLLDSNIRLHITDNLVETAANQTVVVDTTGSERGDFPIDLRDYAAIPETQGMLWSDWLYYYGTEIPGLNHVRTPDPLHPTDSRFDQMFATYEEPIPHQTVDLTKLNTVDYTFELRGGSLQDIVVVDEDALSADLYLDFDVAADNGEGWSRTDTLEVWDGAAIRAADMENVFDLEIINLVAKSNSAQTWTIELNNHVINQPTAREPLTIRIDPNVPAGSKVYVVFSENNTDLAENNVIIERNSNVQVYIVLDQRASNYDVFLANEDQYNQDIAAWHFNDSPYGVIVKTAQFFTENADNLQGYADDEDGIDETFIAQTLDHVQAGDQVNGYGGTDTVELRFAVANQDESLAWQLQWVGLHSIEVLRFDTENQVMFDSIDFDEDFFATDLETIVSGDASDTLLNIERSGMFFRLEEGNDQIDFTAEGLGQRNDMFATIDGGAGNDSVAGSYADDIFLLGSVETVRGHAGDDEFTYSHAYDMDGNNGNIFVDGGSGEDSLNLDNDGTGLNKDETTGVATVYRVERINGGADVDVIDAFMGARTVEGDALYESNSMYVYGNGGADSIRAQSSSDSYVYVSGGEGNDWLSANNNSGSVMVEGGEGDDVIIAGWGTPNYVTVLGGTGDDNITARANDSVWIEGNANSDVINVTIGGAFALSDSVASGQVWGDTSFTADNQGSADTINVRTNDAVTVHGGGGGDSITVNSDADGGGSTYVFGQDGSDTINVLGDAATFINAGADRSHDHINLQALGSNVDTIVFGNIIYGADQFTQTTDTQGKDVITGFNFENGSGVVDPAFPGPDDVMDFSAFLVGSGINIAHRDWHPAGPSGAGDVVVAGNIGSNFVIPGPDIAANNVVVLAVDNQYGLADLANDIYLADLGAPSGIWALDGSRFVVVTAKDPNQNDGTVGFKDYDVYFVQDVDTEANSAVWRIDLVATIDAATYSGAITGVNSAQFINA